MYISELYISVMVVVVVLGGVVNLAFFLTFKVFGWGEGHYMIVPRYGAHLTPGVRTQNRRQKRFRCRKQRFR